MKKFIDNFDYRGMFYRGYKIVKCKFREDLQKYEFEVEEHTGLYLVNVDNFHANLGGF